MFRLVFLTFHGPMRYAPATAHGPLPTAHGSRPTAHSPQPTAHGPQPTVHSHHVHLHDAPPAMAFVLIVLAIGSIAAGWIGLPHALGGHNTFGTFLEPNFVAANCAPEGTLASTGPLAGIALEDCAPGDVALASAGSPPAAELPPPALGTSQPQAAAEPAHDETGLELTLMVVSTVVALTGIALAALFFLKRPELADRTAARFAPLYRLFYGKYYVDELYDATVVQPIKVLSDQGLWRVVDMKIIDGAVNGTGYIVGGLSGVLRLLQNGSVKAYAASTFVGVVLILAYYVWR
jgi:NADH-quinone oxidoreductase subunit L